MKHTHDSEIFDADEDVLTYDSDSWQQVPLTHVTREGKRMLIAEMEDSHLLNTINLWIRKAEQAKDILESPQTNAMNRAIYGTSASPEEAERMVRVFATRIPYYVFEADLRSLNVPWTRIRTLLGRSAPLTPARHLLEEF